MVHKSTQCTRFTDIDINTLPDILTNLPSTATPTPYLDLLTTKFTSFFGSSTSISPGMAFSILLALIIILFLTLLLYFSKLFSPIKACWCAKYTNINPLPKSNVAGYAYEDFGGGAQGHNVNQGSDRDASDNFCGIVRDSNSQRKPHRDTFGNIVSDFNAAAAAAPAEQHTFRGEDIRWPFTSTSCSPSSTAYQSSAASSSASSIWAPCISTSSALLPSQFTSTSTSKSTSKSSASSAWKPASSQNYRHNHHQTPSRTPRSRRSPIWTRATPPLAGKRYGIDKQAVLRRNESAGLWLS